MLPISREQFVSYFKVQSLNNLNAFQDSKSMMIGMMGLHCKNR